MDAEQGQRQLSEGLASDIRAALHRYDGAVLLATAIGVLELIKAELIGGCDTTEVDDDD